MEVEIALAGQRPVRTWGPVDGLVFPVRPRSKIFGLEAWEAVATRDGGQFSRW